MFLTVFIPWSVPFNKEGKQSPNNYSNTSHRLQRLREETLIKLGECPASPESLMGTYTILMCSGSTALQMSTNNACICFTVNNDDLKGIQIKQ